MTDLTPRPMPEPTAERTAANALFSFASFLATAVLVAVTTPIVVHQLGAEQYGIFSLSLTVVNFLALLDAGISTALVRFVADRAALGDTLGINRLASATLMLYLGVGAVAVAGTALVAGLFVDDLFNLSRSAIAPARFAFLFAGVAFFFTFISKVFGAVILGLQRNDVSSMVKIGVTTVTGIGTIILVYVGFGVRSLLLLAAAVAALTLGVNAWMAHRLLPQLSVRSTPSPTLLLSTLKFSSWIFVANATAFLLFQLDRLILGMLKTVSSVTYYAVPGSIASYLYVAVANLAGITIAVATGLFARQQGERVIQLYLRATRFVVVFLVAVAVPALFLAHPILEFWIGPTFAARSTGVLRVLVVTYVLLGLAVMPYNVILAAGKPRILGLVNLALFCINLALIFLLVPPYGVIGAAWAYLLSVVPLLSFVIYAERRVLGITQSHWPVLLKSLALPTLIASAACALMLHVATSLAEVLLAAGLTASILVVLYLIKFAEQGDRQLVVQFVERATRRALAPARRRS